jgi:hypothetical protein
MLPSGATGEGSCRRWFHVNLGDTPQWPNKHLLSSLIADKRKNLEEMPRLKVMIKWVTELCQVRLEACHCVEEFILQRIRPLSHREKLASECL